MSGEHGGAEAALAAAAPMPWRERARLLAVPGAPAAGEVHLFRMATPAGARDDADAGSGADADPDADRDPNSERDAPEPDASEAALAPDERERARRFRAPQARRAFVARRLALRRILGGYLGVAPQAVVLAADVRGKLGVPAAPDLTFSLASSAGLALFAVARGAAVGVDVERLRFMPDAAELARRFFASVEADALAASADAGARDRLFFFLWTRKEAYLKGLGVGLSGDLACPLVGSPPPPWRLQSFRPDVATIASVATAADTTLLRFVEDLPS